MITGEGIPFFRINELRPYHNEIKLAYPTAAMSFNADKIEMYGNRLIVGFELLEFRAVVEVNIAPTYMTFSLSEFLTDEDSFGLGVIPMSPPVESFEIVRLELNAKDGFGRWLNVSYDGDCSVGVLSSSPYGRAASHLAKDRVRLYGELLCSERLYDEPICLLAAETEGLLDVIDNFERDYDLPLGVQARRNELINRSYYWCADVNPLNVDEHIEYCKRGGFELMSLYYTSILKEEGGFISVGEYDSYRSEYPRGKEDLVEMLDKIKAAGIKPGLHVLPTHIGLHSKYLTPVADRRLNLKEVYTLSKDLSFDDDVIFVDERPNLAPTYEKTRMIRIMGELVKYESFTTERPYRFLGCERGYNGTTAAEYKTGTALGILDLSEYCANSAYVNLKTDLIDEIADGIAELYSAGFEFLYFDGAEGVNPPFDVNVALAQKKIYDRLEKKPIFCEAAAKSHFSWHIVSGGNAYDIFAPSVFKEMMVKHPFAEAERMQDDFTRVNFGWWSLCKGHTPDTIEYGTALAAAWDCPGALRGDLAAFGELPRVLDMLDVIRTWEDARRKGIITDEIKSELRKTEKEHTLIINEMGEYELCQIERVESEQLKNAEISAFLLEREQGACATIWSNIGECRILLPLEDVSLYDELGSECLEPERTSGGFILPVGKKRYITTSCGKDELLAALMKAETV